MFQNPPCLFLGEERAEFTRKQKHEKNLLGVASMCAFPKFDIYAKIMLKSIFYRALFSTVCSSGNRLMNSIGTNFG